MTGGCDHSNGRHSFEAGWVGTTPVPRLRWRWISRRTVVRLVALLVIGELSAGLTVVARQSPSVTPTVASVAAHAAPMPASLPDPAVQARTQRATAVRDLLSRRAAAVLSRDRVAFLATVDPDSPAFAAQQAAMFDAMAQVPFATFAYDLDQNREDPHSGSSFDRYGSAPVWVPRVTLRFALSGVDPAPTVQDQRLTFVQRGERWLLASTSDLAGTGQPTPENLWDFGAVSVERTPHVLVLGHPDAPALLRRVAEDAERVVPQVSAVWGAWTEQVVVLVPESKDELESLLGNRADLTRIAAVATAELLDGQDGASAVGDRVLLNPVNFAQLSPLGRRIVLTHEITHVASRAATGRTTPTWLVEGLADYVGYRSSGLAVRTVARELAAEVQAGTVPAGLPADTDFDGSNERLPAVYEMSWLAVRLVVERVGEPGLLQLYRLVGGARAGTGDAALQEALSAVLGMTVEEFTAVWQAELRRQLL